MLPLALRKALRSGCCHTLLHDLRRGVNKEPSLGLRAATVTFPPQSRVAIFTQARHKGVFHMLREMLLCATCRSMDEPVAIWTQLQVEAFLLIVRILREDSQLASNAKQGPT